jgi:hypothetical protein
VTFLLWSHEEARAKGISVDLKKLADWTEWSRKDTTEARRLIWLTAPILDTLQRDGMPADVSAKLAPFTTKPELKGGVKESTFQAELAKALTSEELSQHQAAILQHAGRGKGDGGGVDTMGQLLLAGSYGGDENREFVSSTRAHLAGYQKPDGSWSPNGQLKGMNRAEGEATAITTMWLAFALGSTSESTVKATEFARKAAKGKTTEWLVARTLMEKKLGEPDAHEEFLRELLSRQNPDGGWSPMPETASDGFATGLALYAVTEAGPADNAVVRRARKFLVESQTPDGSWTIPPASWTKTASTPERIQKLDPIYRYWGTAWASIGLARTLPEK